MNKEYSLEEDVRHGTPKQPMTAMHFTTGPGTVYPEHFWVQRHWHHNVEILKVVKGSYTVELNLEEYVLKAGDICFINSGELHQIEGKERDTIHNVLIFNPHILEFVYEDEVQEGFIEPFLAHVSSLPRIVGAEDELYGRISGLFDQAVGLALEEKSGWYFKVKLLLMEMLYEAGRSGRMVSLSSIQSASEKERIDRYKRIISYMEEHFAEKVSLEQLAGEAQCNPQYLCHFFKEIAGVSPIQYLINYRIEQAREMLADTTKTVLEVSLDCGFENVSYFIRQFKKATGGTPREFRRGQTPLHFCYTTLS